MSKENAKKFLNVMKDKDAREAWKKKTADVKSDEETLDVAVDMAKEMGYAVTKKELTDTLKELKAKQKEKTQKAVQGVQQLELDDLKNVAGGLQVFSPDSPYDCDKPMEEKPVDNHIWVCLFDNLCGWTWN